MLPWWQRQTVLSSDSVSVAIVIVTVASATSVGVLRRVEPNSTPR